MTKLVDIKDFLINEGPPRSSVKCCLCDKGAVWEPVIEGLPYYCEHHAPWGDEDKEWMKMSDECDKLNDKMD